MEQERLTLLRKKAAALPAEPGIYLMKDKDGRILYVGKSRKLKNRVGSYFVGRHARKTERMVAAVADFDTVLCGSEMEALTLENTLIKKHKPPFNIKLKDAKSYPYLKLTDEPYPRLIVTRDRTDGRGDYFGPYPGMGEAYAAMEAVTRAFRLPTCRRRFPEDVGKERPCLYADMGRCRALCRTLPRVEEYAELVRGVRRVLSGHIGDTVAAVETAMAEAAEDERFEEAARLRDTAAALRRLRDKQRVVSDPDVECDAVALYGDEGGGVLSVLSIREGALVSKCDYPLAAGELTDAPAIFTFLGGLYRTGTVPHELLLGFSAEEEELWELSETLSALAGRRVAVLVPERGKKKQLCDMARENARLTLERREAEREVRDRTAVRLASLLGLEVVPDRIEAFDISELGHEAITASMVVFCEGKKKPSDYRLFRMTEQEGVDDYAAMRTAIARRAAHFGDGSPSLGTPPDLILVDGGRGQVNAAREALRAAGAEIPVFGMVKDDYHKTRALSDGEGDISIATDRGLYSFIYTIQEEAHRFAVKSVHKKKRQALRHSALLDIEGIGSVKARLLLQHYGSIKRLSEASAEEIAALPKITALDAKRIRAYFEKRNGDGL
ncbi:MAG: excinuclease ABC subunit UvrC [Clostridia bacterium]|nr:excinuclease ABC subunit UvrC [Clostridia bacterium]